MHRTCGCVHCYYCQVDFHFTIQMILYSLFQKSDSFHFALVSLIRSAFTKLKTNTTTRKWSQKSLYFYIDTAGDEYFPRKPLISFFIPTKNCETKQNLKWLYFVYILTKCWGSTQKNNNKTQSIKNIHICLIFTRFIHFLIFF